MAINNCPTCGGMGYLVTEEDPGGRCWCSWATPDPAPPRVKAVYWIDEIPPGKITDVVKKFLATGDEFTADELSLLKWYVGQWCDRLMALAEDSMTAEAFAEQSDFNDGWMPRLAAVSNRQQLVEVHGWLMEKGIDPF